jgi:hypothetical protein
LGLQWSKMEEERRERKDVGRFDDDDNGEELEAKRRRRGHTDNWTVVEEAQLKKAMIVFGNKKWKEMAKYFPQKSATQLRLKYKELGGAWNQLKMFMHEYRFLAKAERLGEREPSLTEEEIRTLESGQEISFLFEKPLSTSSKRGTKDGGDSDDSENSDDDEDDDEDDDYDDEDEAPKVAVKRRNKPVSAVLVRLKDEQIEAFKEKRVMEILEQNSVKKMFEHKSMAHLNRLRQLIPAPAPPPEPVFGAYSSVEDVSAKVSGLVTSRLFSAASVEGRACVSMSLDQPAEATLESSRVFLRAPVFLKVCMVGGVCLFSFG